MTSNVVPPRLRVVIMGNSTGVQVRPRRFDREDGNYGEVLERRLRERGIDALVLNQARWWELIPQGFRRWEDAVSSMSPDVLVLNYGLGECQPRVVPNTVLRYLSTWRTSLHPAAAAWRRAVVKPVFRAVVWATPRLTVRAGLRTWRVGPARFEREIRRLIVLTRQETGALVLVLTPNPPGPFLQRLMPGIDERARRYDELARKIVAEAADEQVRLVDAAAVVERLGWRRAMTDGLHYTVRGHREVASLLEDALLEWMASPAAPTHLRRAPRVPVADTTSEQDGDRDRA